jgi:hypothetical protein
VTFYHVLPVLLLPPPPPLLLLLLLQGRLLQRV